MNQRLIRALTPLLLGMLFAQGAAADTRDEVREFRSYPYIERAYKALEKQRPAEAEELARHVLSDIAPDSAKAQSILIEALGRQGRYRDALALIDRLPPELRASTLSSLHAALIGSNQPPSRTEVLQWLKEMPVAADRDRLIISYGQLLTKQQGIAAARKWAQNLPEQYLTSTLRSKSAVLAERDKDWQAVIDYLQPMQRQGQLQSDDWRRLALAYGMQVRKADVISLLNNPPSAEDDAWLRDALANRAIGLGMDTTAKNLLQPLEQANKLDNQQRAQLLELARKQGDIQLALTLADELQRPCLETAEWLASVDAQHALKFFQGCPATADPQRWLILAERLHADQLIATTTLSQPWDGMRKDYQINRAIERADYASAQQLLAHQPDTPERSAQLALLAQKQGDHLTAGHWWQNNYQATRTLRAADLASFQLLEAAQPEQARQFLEQVWRDHNKHLPELLTARLADIYAQTPGVALRQLQAFNQSLNAAQRGRLLSALAAAGQCPQVSALAGPTPQDGLTLRALGQCSMPDKPGQAVVYLQQAVEAGDTSSRGELAYALAASGQPQQAYELFASLPAKDLDSNARMAQARSAKAAGLTSEAEQLWQRLPQGDIDYWRLGADIADANQQPALALTRQNEVLARKPVASDFYRAGQIAYENDNAEQGLAWLRRAAELEPNVAVYQAEYGLRLAALPTPEERAGAIAPLTRASALQPQDYRIAEALAARHLELNQRPEAVKQLRRAIDLEQPPLAALGETGPELSQRRYNDRRQHQILEQRDSVNVSMNWSPEGVATTADQREQTDFTQGLQWEHSLLDATGQQLFAYGRLFGSGHDSTFQDVLGGGVGLRYVPIRGQNINLYAELYRDDFDINDNDLMLRASASFLDQGEYRNDWRPAQNSWNERDLYLDGAWWVDESERLLLGRFTQGRAFKLPTNSAQTISPYGMFQTTEQDGQQDFRVGAGLRWQLWFNQTHYSAYKSRIALKVEYQQSLGGSLYDGSNGWLFGVELGL